jgi:hypothetical protein
MAVQDILSDELIQIRGEQLTGFAVEESETIIGVDEDDPFGHALYQVFKNHFIFYHGMPYSPELTVIFKFTMFWWQVNVSGRHGVG